ncbi:hypothetical protein ACHAWO_009319 [Cyclotella atomus]|uniref:RAP domain-containing protein n=1 Tax=Cyclotella atomus TaxID=382360 RepID=A0ABD3MNJ0_9STRA
MIIAKDKSFGHFAKAADRQLIEFDERHLSNLAYAYALVDYNPKFNDGSNLFQKIGDKSIICINRFKPQELANLVWAYATLRSSHSALYEAVGNHVVQSNDFAEFEPQSLVNILWAYATLDAKHLSCSMCLEITRFNLMTWLHSNLRSFPTFFGRMQNWIHNTLSYSISLEITWFNPMTAVLPAFFKVGATISSLQKDVEHEFKSIDLNLFEEYIASSGSIDTLVEVDGRRIGIKVDGPSHFINRKPTATTLLKRRQISTIDKIALVSVPYWEWNKLRKDRPTKQQYLRSLIGI